MRLIGPSLILAHASGCAEGLTNYDDVPSEAGFETGAWWDDAPEGPDPSADTNTDDPFNDTNTDEPEDTSDTSSNNNNTGAGVLLIQEICDHAESGQVKYVEVYNPGSTPVAMGGYSLQLYSNGSQSPTNFDFPAISLPAGSTFVVGNAGNGASLFTGLYGREADAISGIANGNGDDAYALARNGTVVDVYGQIGTDGTGETWEYTDSVVKRLGTQPSPFFQMADWDVFGGAGQSAPFSAN